MPVVILFNPMGAQTRLVSELDPEDTDIAFGLADLGFGTPELGYFSIAEIVALYPSALPIPVEWDLYFQPTKTLSEYADEARQLGRIEV